MKNYAESTLARKPEQELLEILREEHDVNQAPGEMPKADLVAWIIELQDSRTHMLAEQAALESGVAPTDESEEASTTQPSVGFLADHNAWEHDRVLVKFFEQPGPDGKLPIDCSLNGRAYRVPRNQEVAVPRAVLQTLDNCIIEQHEQEIDGGKVTNSESHIPRFPYQVIRDPAPKAGR